MKQILLLIAFTLLGTLAQAQLSNTRWTGALLAPERMDVTLVFKTDVFEVVTKDEGVQVESMTYSISGDTLLLKKTSGGSPCPDGSAFKVKFSIQDEKLTITPLSDDCTMRSDSWTKEPFIRAKD